MAEPFPFNFIDNAIFVEGDLILSIIVRTAIMFFAVLLIIRWMGKKGFGQLTMFELLIVLGLSSAIGDPMVYTDAISITQAIVAIVIVIALFKLVDYLTTRYKKFKRLTVSDPILLAKDGKLLKENLYRVRLEEEEFCSHMRINGIEDISEVKLSYLEINGHISFIKKKGTAATGSD